MFEECVKKLVDYGVNVFVSEMPHPGDGYIFSFYDLIVSFTTSFIFTYFFARGNRDRIIPFMTSFSSTI